MASMFPGNIKTQPDTGISEGFFLPHLTETELCWESKSEAKLKKTLQKTAPHLGVNAMWKVLSKPTCLFSCVHTPTSCFQRIGEVKPDVSKKRMESKVGGAEVWTHSSKSYPGETQSSSCLPVPLVYRMDC